MQVLVVDDHELFRDGISSLLRARGYEVVGEASDGLEAVVRARELKPDLVLMDIRMPHMSGLEATRIITAEMPQVKVVMLTVSEDEEDLFEAIKSGAQGYLLKKLKADIFFDLIAGVARGEAPISPKMAAKMLEEFSRQGGKAAGRRSLTEREMEVLRLITQGKSNKNIAAELSISESTVKYHLQNILDKLHLENRAQVIAYATRRGLGGKEDSSAGW
jgi:DNA-binding NarL/FixJ family response regulator